MKSAPLFFACVCIVSPLCLMVAESVSAQEKERINLLRPKNTNAPRRETQRPAPESRIIQGIQSAADTEKRNTGLGTYFLFLGIAAVLIAGLVYWHILRQKHTEWELNDPMALVKELNFVHQLSETEKRLMQELSERNALSSPLRLFVEPKYLLEAQDNDFFASSHPTVRRLLSKLFDITTEGGEGSTIAGMNSKTKIYAQGV